MLNFTDEQARAAKRLAIAYQAYHEALGVRTPDADNTLCVFGEMLLDAMAETGIVITSPDNVAGCVDAAKSRLRQPDEWRLVCSNPLSSPYA